MRQLCSRQGRLAAWPDPCGGTVAALAWCGQRKIRRTRKREAPSSGGAAGAASGGAHARCNLRAFPFPQGGKGTGRERGRSPRPTAAQRTQADASTQGPGRNAQRSGQRPRTPRAGAKPPPKPQSGQPEGGSAPDTLSTGRPKGSKGDQRKPAAHRRLAKLRWRQ